ncbi:MAG: hypothetical protein WC812_00740 [Candidatus Pacearchaeota archaeon]|jgi:hypothetical protein
MMDIFEHPILCNECGKPMKDFLVSKNGFNLRIKKCEKCNLTAIHPQDKVEYENFMRLKQKEYSVKMRMVGNSYAVSIPREIVDFMKEQERMIDNMVKLSFEESGRLKLMFNTPESNENSNSRIIKAKEVKIMKNGKVFHAQQFSDSAHPERNKTIIKRKED